MEHVAEREATEVEVATMLTNDLTRLRQMATGISNTNYPLYHAILAHIGTMESKINRKWGVEIEEAKQVLSDGALAEQQKQETSSEQSSKAEDETKKEEGTGATGKTNTTGGTGDTTKPSPDKPKGGGLLGKLAGKK